MDDDLILDTSFWKRWDEANELEKPKLVQELMIVHSHRGYRKGMEDGFANLLNSYFEDLRDYMKEEQGETVNGK